MIEALALFLVALAVLCIALAVGGALVDWIDPYSEREDSLRRNGRRR